MYFACCEQDQQSLRRRQGIGDVRRVRLHKEANEGLGVSITVSIAMILVTLLFVISYKLTMVLQSTCDLIRVPFFII